ncbi:hypothetical protein ES708_26576 [subsurface metagenome]
MKYEGRCNVIHTTKVDIKHKIYTQRPPSRQTKQRVATQLVHRFFKSGLESLGDYEIVELLFSLALS